MLREIRGVNTPKPRAVNVDVLAQGSFLKRGSSSNQMALLAKSGSQMGNTRSFIFGCENSNSGTVAADSQSQVHGPFTLISDLKGD